MEVVGKDSVSTPKDIIEKINDGVWGEEINQADKPYTIVSTGKTLEAIIAVDGGSTGTRAKIIEIVDGKIMDLEELSKIDYYEIPSDMVALNNISSIQGFASNNLSDQLFSKVTTFDVDNFLKNTFLVRGSLMESLNEPVRSIGSTGTKVRNEVYYYNIIDSIPYALIMKYNGSLPSVVKVHLSVSLPPEDENERDFNFLKSKLTKFNWVHPTGASVLIEFVSHFVITEPQAQDIALRMNEDPEAAERRRRGCVHNIEGGGRSIGNNVTRGGISVPPCKKTLDYAAKFIEDELASIVRSKRGIRLNRSVIKEAVSTGIIRIGRDEKMSVVEDIIRIKDEMAARIAIDIKRECYDSQRAVLPSDVTDIVMSGGLFRAGLYDYSLAEPLANELFKFIPNAEFEVISENNIPLGLALYAVNRMKLLNQSTPTFAASFSSNFASAEPIGEPSAKTTITHAEVAATKEEPVQPVQPQFAAGFGAPVGQSEGTTQAPTQTESVKSDI